MDRLIYASLAAMRGSMARQTAIANNLANANTPGFRGELANAQSVWLNNPQSLPHATVSEQVISANMAQGTINKTGRSLDVAMEGDSMLVVQSEDGEEAYTRRGDLQVSSTGLLTTGDGRPVMGSGGPITLPPADSVSIAANGAILVVPQGGDASQPQEVDKLRVVSTKGSDVVKQLDGLFGVRGGGSLPDDPDARVQSGALEGSNVTASDALVQMIEASRQWDVQLKMIGDARENDRAATELMSMPQ
ncbi:Flagellar basal-body rod protein FlgF [Sphingomonas antarctica]|uniref:flagellar basal-body rod protein FlgF n=1 Tax=Sphingomonas antarctica TaxID=2040274 RepID=UPI0039EC7FE2